MSRLIVYSVQTSGTKHMSFFNVFERVVFAGLRKGITRLEEFSKPYPSCSRMTRLIAGTCANSVDDRLIKHFSGTAVIGAASIRLPIRLQAQGLRTASAQFLFATLSSQSANQQPPKTSGSRAMSNQEREKEAKTNSAATKKEGHRHDHPGQLAESRKAIAASKRPLATDQAAISMLKTAQMKLSKADHDYAGHRVQAMRHVAHALDHLTGSFLFDEHAVSGFGNLAQAESDRLVREAEGHLNFIENTLRARTNSLEHHQSARTSVAEAIRELRIALTIR